MLQVMNQRQSWPFELLGTKRKLEPNLGIILPVERRVHFTTAGYVVELSEPWHPPYAPCIDQVLYEVALAYGHRAGAIIFTGMGEDGAHGAKFLYDKGGLLWSQQPETCACDSMPRSVMQFACVSGSPEELARTFVMQFQEGLSFNDLLH